MKYLLVLPVMLCTLSLMAQSPDTTEVSSAAKQEFLVTRLTEELNLTGEQQEAVRVLIAERSENIKEAKTQDKLLIEVADFKPDTVVMDYDRGEKKVKLWHQDSLLVSHDVCDTWEIPQVISYQ